MRVMALSGAAKYLRSDSSTKSAGNSPVRLLSSSSRPETTIVGGEGVGAGVSCVVGANVALGVVIAWSFRRLRRCGFLWFCR